MTDFKHVDVNINYYSVLGLTSEATSKEIDKAFRVLAKETHPDLNKSEDAAERFKEVQDAYDVLKNDTNRFQYDAMRHAAGKSPRKAGGFGSPPPPGTTTTYQTGKTSGYGARNMKSRYHTPNPYNYTKKIFASTGEYNAAPNYERTSSFSPPPPLNYTQKPTPPPTKDIRMTSKAKVRVNLAFCIIPFVCVVGAYHAATNSKGKQSVTSRNSRRRR